MRIGVLGSGMVGQAVGARLAELGHGVTLGTRDPSDLTSKKGQGAPLGEWQAASGARVATFAEAASGAELIVNALNGEATLPVFGGLDAAALNGKTILDIANPLDFSRGMPPTLTVKDTDSLAEQLQRAVPGAHVVKTLNTMTAAVMVRPEVVAAGDHTVFVSGNDAGAKAQVTDLLRSFGWRDILDLGELSTARGTEMLLPLWLRTWGALGTGNFQFKVAR